MGDGLMVMLDSWVTAKMTAKGSDMGSRKASGMEPAVVGVARRKAIDVPGALRRANRITSDETLANELVTIAVDADATTLPALLETLERIDDQLWRARTLFSIFKRTSSHLTKQLPDTAQDQIIGLVVGLDDEAARAAALCNLPSELPASLRTRLAVLGDAMEDPVRRLQVAVHFHAAPTRDQARSFLETAKGIDDEDERGHALALVAPVLDAMQLEEAFTAATAIGEPNVAVPALVAISARMPDDGRRQHAQEEIFAAATAMSDPVRQFGVLVALSDLPAELQGANERLAFGLAAGFDEPELRCRAMLATSGLVRDEIMRDRAVLAALAAAECVLDERRRADLLLILRPAGPSLTPTVRRELTRAAGRITDQAIQGELQRTLGRFFSYERADTRGEGVSSLRTEPRWDVFISHSTADLEQARFLASELKSRGLRVFLSADALDALTGSTSWTAAIDDALDESRALLVLLSKDALESRWVTEEWRKYYRLMVDREVGRLLSVRLSGPPIADLPLTLRMYQCIDSTTGRIESSHVTRIIDIVRGL